MLILPFPRLKLALDVDKASPGEVLAAVFRGLVPDDDAMPFRLALPVTVAIRVAFIRGDIQGRAGLAGLRVPDFRVSSETTDNHCLVEHCSSLKGFILRRFMAGVEVVGHFGFRKFL